MLALLAGCALLQSCKVGPNYKQPLAPSPPAFKEEPPPNFKEAEAQGWKQSQPGDAYLKGKWWEVYNDPALNALEEQVSISNQNVLQAEATLPGSQGRGARGARGAVSHGHHHAGDHRDRLGRQCGGSHERLDSSGAQRAAMFDLAVQRASWEPDIWGSIRRGITAAATTAQADRRRSRKRQAAVSIRARAGLFRLARRAMPRRIY